MNIGKSARETRECCSVHYPLARRSHTKAAQRIGSLRWGQRTL